jgi:hypothetical protein
MRHYAWSLAQRLSLPKLGIRVTHNVLFTHCRSGLPRDSQSPLIMIDVSYAGLAPEMRLALKTLRDIDIGALHQASFHLPYHDFL